MSHEPLTCIGCGAQGRRYRRGLCGPCALAEDLHAALDNGRGQIRLELVPLFAGLVAMTNPRAGVNWINRPHVFAMLRALARPDTALTHETLDGMSPWRSVAYLRDLLMQYGVLPTVDRHLLLFERWLRATLPEVHRDADRRTLERFATWHLRRRLQTFADRGPVTGNQTQQAREEARQAIAFLAWLRDRDRDRDLSSCGQADIDAWYAGTYIARRRTHAFLRWAMSNKLLRRVTIPHQDTRNPMPVSQQQRLRVIRRLLTDEDMPLLTRVAAVLMLLYAQPLTRILRLRLDDVTEHDGQVAIRLGDPPTPVPAPFAELLLRHRRSRPNLTTATNPDAPWLFPGRRGAQPMTPTALEKRLRQQGIPTITSRTAALRHLVLQAPAPVVARMLGYTHDHTARLVSEAGGAWSRYAPGDHSR